MRLSLTFFVLTTAAGLTAACSSSEVADAGQDAATESATTDAPNDALDASCHDVVNAAPIVHASVVSGPFPTGVGQGGEFKSGAYYLTNVVYYDPTLDAGDPDAGDGGASGPYWRTTIDLQVTLGTLANRTWHVGKVPDLSDSIEHREILVFDAVDTTTVSMHSNCSDLPVAFTAEYTATPTEFTIWIPSAKRVETYTVQ